MENFEQTRAVVIEPNERWRRHFEILLAEPLGPPWFEIHSDVEHALKALQKEGACLAIVGFELHGVNPVEVIACVKAIHPTIQIIAMGLLEDSRHLTSLLAAGADAVVSKAEPSMKLFEAIDTVRHGGAYMSVSFAKLFVESLRRHAATRSHLDGLSPREIEVIQLLATGLTDSSIAQSLGIAARTVSTHLHNIYEKIGVRTRAAAVAKFYGQALPIAQGTKEEAWATHPRPTVNRVHFGYDPMLLPSL
jgi:DNA-binding NarL/FixJ family response regulator